MSRFGALPKYLVLVVTGVSVLCSGNARAMWVPPDDTVPAERLLANLKKQLSEDPDSHDLLSQIARVHSRAYAMPDVKLDVFDGPPGSSPENPDTGDALKLYEKNRVAQYDPAGDRDSVSEDQVAHLRAAIRYYQKAAAHEEGDMYDWLGLGFTLEQAARIAKVLVWPYEGEFDPEAVASLRRAYENRALAAYQQAIEAPEARGGRMMFQSVAQEAGEGIVRILSKRENRSGEAERQLKAARRMVAEEQAQRSHAVTPIILHPSEVRSLDSLLAPAVHVGFDLDGTGRGTSWPWVQPDTAFLVWDADGRGDVLSGRSLIGSVTWWLFWETGYDVLRALDDNEDGWLRGAELAGLAIWQDRDSNGASDAGEVRSLDSAGIGGLAVASTSEVNGMPANLNGLELEDGRRLPTYDWITSPVKAAR